MGNSNLHVVQVRPEGPEAHSPGQWTQAARPEGAEALSPGRALKKSLYELC